MFTIVLGVHTLGIIFKHLGSFPPLRLRPLSLGIPLFQEVRS